MDEVVMLLGDKPRQILEYLRKNAGPMRMSYMLDGQWYSCTAGVTTVYPNTVALKTSQLSHLDYLEEGKTVGIWFECDIHGGQERFLFGSTIAGTGFISNEPGARSITIAMPDEIEVIRKKSLHRAELIPDTNVEVQLSHRNGSPEAVQVRQGFSARLINISADGLAVAIDNSIGPDFSKDQYVSAKFIPFENETDLSLNAYVRRVEQALLSDELLLDMEIVGLEASCEGRMVLRRLCNAVGRYRALAQSMPQATPPLGVRTS